jgi:hypothetical protein
MVVKEINAWVFAKRGTPVEHKPAAIEVPYVNGHLPPSQYSTDVFVACLSIGMEVKAIGNTPLQGANSMLLIPA